MSALKYVLLIIMEGVHVYYVVIVTSVSPRKFLQVGKTLTFVFSW